MSKNGDLIANFHAYLLTEKRVSDNTFVAYRRDIEQFNEFLTAHDLSLETIQKKQLNTFLKQLRDRGVTAKTLSRKISSIKLFFNYIHDQFNVANVAKALAFPKLEKTLPTYLTEAEVQQLLSAANLDNTDKGVRNKVMLYLMYATGIRVSELVATTTDRIHFDSGFLQLTGKGNKERMVPLPKNIVELLRYYLDHIYPKLITVHMQEKKQSNAGLGKQERRSKQQYLFAANYNGAIKPISRQSFWMILKKVLTKAGIAKNVSPHSLRHSLATHLLKNGADIRSLQLLLGHENIATVQVYTHLEKSQLRKVYDEKHPRA